MNMFSDCRENCTLCSISGKGGCLAGHGDDYFHWASKEELMDRYNKEEVLKLYMEEYGNPYNRTNTRDPQICDVKESYCAYRMGFPEYEDGCYTTVDKGARGSFPVYVIEYGDLRC